MNTRFAYASLVNPGCPPPVNNFQTQSRVGGEGVTGQTCLLRNPASVTEVLNSVAESVAVLNRIADMLGSEA